MERAGTRLARKRAQDQPCEHRMLRDGGNTGPGLRSGFTGGLRGGPCCPSVEPTRPARKLGGRPAVRLGVGEIERGIPRPTSRYPHKCTVPTGNRERNSPRARERQTQRLRQADTKIEKGQSKASSGRWTGRRSQNAAVAPQRSFGEGARGRRRAAWISPRTGLESRSAARGWVTGSWPLRGGEGRRRNRSPLRGPRLRVPSSLLAITQVRLPLGRKPLGRRRAPLSSGGAGLGVSGSRSSSDCASALVARALSLPWGDDGWALSLLLPAPAGVRVNFNIQGPNAVKAAAPGSERFAGSAGKRRTRLRHRSRAPAAAAVCSRRAPPRRHSARPLPPRPTPLRELRPGLALFRLGQPLGGRD